jgi:hypothetical protein
MNIALSRSSNSTYVILELIGHYILQSTSFDALLVPKVVIKTFPIERHVTYYGAAYGRDAFPYFCIQDKKDFPTSQRAVIFLRLATVL